MNKFNQLEIKENIYKTMKILNINRMPTSKEVRSVGISGLDGYITYTGGYIWWAEKLNLPMKNKLTKWNDEEIKTRIVDIVSILNLKRMPSRSEIIGVETNNSLHNAIIRSYGYFGWAEKLGLELKDSETLMGINYQKYCKEQLEKMGYIVDHTSVKAPYDLLVNNNIRIDVKSGSAYDLRGSRVHTFGINKKFPTCDLYIIYALDEEAKEIERTFIIPSKYLKLITLSLGENSKYNIYLNRWDFIEKYNGFYKNIS